MKRHLLQVLFIVMAVSIAAQWTRGEAVIPAERVEFAETRLPAVQKPSPIVPTPSAKPVTLEQTKEASKDRIASVKVPPPRINMNPTPSTTYDQPRNLPDLSVRGLFLGMTEAELLATYGSGKIDNRLETYWRGGHGRSARIGATWHRYRPYWGSFDLEGVCGAAYGDGLERYGVPILTHGDSGADVESLLGPPSYAGLSRFARNGEETVWTYRYREAGLQIHFTAGKITRFDLQSHDFSDSGC